MDAPRQDLIRATFQGVASDDGNTLVGYAAVFNEWTEIDSWEGRFLERLVPGAFARTLQHRGAPKILFNHGMDPQIGDKPLGKGTAVEDERGLLLTVPLDDTSYNRDLKALIASGAIDGQSFRFSVPKGGDRWDDDPPASDHNPDRLPERTLVEVACPEAGPVTFPAYEATTAGIRSRQAFAAWLAIPPAARAVALAGEIPDLSATVTDTAETQPGDPPARHSLGLTKGQREKLFREHQGVLST